MSVLVHAGGEPGAAPVPHLSRTSDVVELVEEFGYWLAACRVRALAGAARRLQPGGLARGTVDAAGPGCQPSYYVI
jgi:hypothetical protein